MFTSRLNTRGWRTFRGRLRMPPAEAYEKLRRRLAADTIATLSEDEGLGAAITLLPQPTMRRRAVSHTWVNWLLLGLTIATTTWAGAAHRGVDLLKHPGQFAIGLPYALALMAILGIHEMGHYLTARRLGLDVTAPYFIPVPFGLGTFGAFIQMRSAPEDRRSLFDVAVAGPLAGLALAIPALLIGLHSSTVVPGVAASASYFSGGASAGSSILLAVLSKLSLGNALQDGCLLRLSPLAFAGWLGLLVTALNLLPIGQLDGGHIATAMFGARAGRAIGGAALGALFFLGLFVWPGLLTWAILVFFLAGRSAPPLNEFTPLTRRQQILGWAAFAILLLILVPLPHSLWSEMGIRCPYV